MSTAQNQTPEAKQDVTAKSIPLHVVEILCQTRMDDVLSKVLTAITQTDGYDRRLAVLRILLDLDHDDNSTIIEGNTNLARNIIHATLMSFNSESERINFLQDIAGATGKRERQLKFTAATVTFHIEVRDMKFSAGYAKAFARLLIESCDVTLVELAAFWQLPHWKDVKKQFGDWCEPATLNRFCILLIVGILNELQALIESKGKPVPKDLAYLYSPTPVPLALSSLISELAHKCISSSAPLGMVNYTRQELEARLFSPAA